MSLDLHISGIIGSSLKWLFVLSAFLVVVSFAESLEGLFITSSTHIANLFSLLYWREYAGLVILSFSTNGRANSAKSVLLLSGMEEALLDDAWEGEGFL